MGASTTDLANSAETLGNKNNHLGAPACCKNCFRSVIIVGRRSKPLVQETITLLKQQLEKLTIAYCSEEELAQKISHHLEQSAIADLNNPSPYLPKIKAEEMGWLFAAARNVATRPVPYSEAGPNSAHELVLDMQKQLPKLLAELNLAFDLVISVGGDGCFLSAAQWALGFNIPVLGVNCGKLGFLSDLWPQRVAQLAQVLDHGWLERRLVLQVNGYLAVNEVLVTGSHLGSLTTWQVEVDQLPLCTYQADGLIVATATGSTGHALSCGGPILEPGGKQLVLVPLASHKLNSRPLVLLPPQQQLRIKIGGKSPTSSVVLDGRVSSLKQPQVEIAVASQELLLFHPADYNFFAALRAKLEWES